VLFFGGVLKASAIPEVWRTWWLGDTCGALVVFPLALAWGIGPIGRLSRRRAAEAVVLLLCVAGLSEAASRIDPPLTYLVFPALAYAAFRFGARGATLSLVIAVGFTVWNVTHDEGGYVYHSLTRSVLSSQLFIVVAVLSTLALVALVNERQAFADRLGRSRLKLSKAADIERRRIERNLHDGAQQRLLALALRLRLAAEQAAEGHPEQVQVLLAESETELQLAVDELRDLAHGIHPAVLTDLGLANAVLSIAARSSIPIRVLELPDHELDKGVEATVYYVLSEAATNAQKHAAASAVTVRVDAVSRWVTVDVSDDGIGGAVERDGSGLQGLRDRVEGVGGTFGVVSPAGRGTRIVAIIPTTLESPA
jgi:signal transduction histidine kinase